jgi:hypothetical protein
VTATTTNLQLPTAEWIGSGESVAQGPPIRRENTPPVGQDAVELEEEYGMTPAPRSALWLSLGLIVCAVAASVATLAWPGAFPPPPGRDGPNGVLAEAQGWSLATLLLAVPVAVVGMMGRDGVQGRLLWAGSLAYFTYTYLSFAVSPPFTQLSLIYIAAVALSIPALVLVVASAPRSPLGARLPRRTVAVLACVFAVGLASAWLHDMVPRLARGEVGWPAGAAAVGHVVHALDLGLLVPLAVSSTLLLMRRAPAADLVAAIFLIVAAEMGGALTAMVAWSSVTAGGSVGAAVPFAIAWAVAVAVAFTFIGRIEST